MKHKYFIKICGVTSEADALAAADAGATAIGFNFYPGSKRYIAPDKARAIADTVRGKVALVGVFVNEPLESVRKIAADVKLTYCQFSGDEGPELVNAVGNAIKAFRIDRTMSMIDFDAYQTSMFLLDAYQPGEYGGTGKTIDWLLAREANEFGKIILAGGLDEHTVTDAIRTAQPWGVDVSSGVESSPGVKDHTKVRNFVANAVAAFTL